MADSDHMDEFEQFMRRVTGALGLSDLHVSESGLVSLSVDDDYVMNIQFIPATGKLMIFLPFLDASRLRGETLRELLTANLFGEETGGGWFGMEPESGSLVYHYMVDFGVSGEPDLDEFIGILEHILELVEIWRVHLSEPDGAAEESASAEVSLDDSLALLHLQEQLRP